MLAVQLPNQDVLNVPWPVWVSLCTVLLSTAAGVVKALFRPVNGTTAAAKEAMAALRALEEHWVETAPLLGRMAQVLDGTAREMAQHTPVLATLLRAAENLNAQFAAHDAADKATFAAIEAQLAAIRETTNFLASQERRGRR